MRYIDLKSGIHSAAEHYDTVRELLKQGYTFTMNTFVNPTFHHFEDKTKEDICILSGIVDDSGYFRI